MKEGLANCNPVNFFNSEVFYDVVGNCKSETTPVDGGPVRGVSRHK